MASIQLINDFSSSDDQNFIDSNLIDFQSQMSICRNRFYRKRRRRIDDHFSSSSSSPKSLRIEGEKFYECSNTELQLLSNELEDVDVDEFNEFSDHNTELCLQSLSSSTSTMMATTDCDDNSSPPQSSTFLPSSSLPLSPTPTSISVGDEKEFDDDDDSNHPHHQLAITSNQQHNVSSGHLVQHYNHHSRWYYWLDCDADDDASDSNLLTLLPIPHCLNSTTTNKVLSIIIMLIASWFHILSPSSSSSTSSSTTSNVSSIQSNSNQLQSSSSLSSRTSSSNRSLSLSPKSSKSNCQSNHNFNFLSTSSSSLILMFIYSITLFLSAVNAVNFILPTVEAAAKNIPQLPTHPFLETIHRRPTTSRPIIPNPHLLPTTVPPIPWRLGSRIRRPNSNPDLQSSDSNNYETYQQAQAPIATTTSVPPSSGRDSNYNNNQDIDLDFSDNYGPGSSGSSNYNQTLELSRLNRPVIRSYPTGDQQQLYCDQNFADLDKNLGLSVEIPDDSLIQQRIIVESEQLELFLRLRPAAAVSNSVGTVDENQVLPERFMDEFRIHTTTTASPKENEELDQQRRRAQCQQMLQFQLDQNSLNSKNFKKPLFELSTSTFNVSCHVVPGPQFQCVLFTFNMHHFGSIFRQNKDPYCSFTFVRFNLIDNRCQLSLIMKRIDPYKGSSSPSSSTNSKSNSKSSKKQQFPVTSSIWDLFQDVPPLMYPFSDQNGTTVPSSYSYNSFDGSGPAVPALNSGSVNDQCATMCQKVFHDDHAGKSGSSGNIPSARRPYNPNEMIILENVHPRCLLQFDQSYARARLKSKKSNSGNSGSGASGNSGSSLSSISSGSSGSQNSGSSGSNSNSNSQDNSKKTCVESSRHILTHNGLVINHPTLRIIPIPNGDSSGDIVEGQTLAPLEFYLKLDSKNLTSNAQYFDLVLKKYKWTASASLLYPDIYPGILTGQTSVSVQSIHNRHNLLNPDLTTNAYFRFVFNNLKVTKWGYRYLLKISLRSNPACYTIETTYGPFDVRGRNQGTSGTTNKDTNSSNPNELRFVWTTSKCHSVKMELQTNVVLDRGSPQIFSSSGNTGSNIPTSRFIDYLCDLNLEKLSTFLINFLANRASGTSGDLLPSPLRLASSTSTGGSKKMRKQFSVKRDYSFTHEQDYTRLVSEFVRDNRFLINGTQCLEMSLQSSNFSLIETTSGSSNSSSLITDMFQQYFQQFHSYHRTQLLQKLINMTFIYSSELLLKIRQIYLDDEPLLKPPPPPPTSAPTKPPHPSKPNKTPKGKTSIKPIHTNSNPNRNVGKRKTENGNSKDNVGDEGEDEEDEDEDENILQPTTTAAPTATQPSSSVIVTRNPDRSRKISSNAKPETGNNNGNRQRTGKAPTGSSSSRQPIPKTTSSPKLVFGNKKDKYKPTPTSASGTGEEEEEDVSVSGEKNFLSGRPMVWIMILFANTLLVLGFIATFAYCYYRRMLAEEKAVASAASGNRKPLKRFIQNGDPQKIDPDIKPLKDDIFMLEKTDYSTTSGSGSSIHEDSHDYQNRRQQQFLRNGRMDSGNGAMKSSAQKVQHINRMTRRMSSLPQEMDFHHHQGSAPPPPPPPPPFPGNNRDSIPEEEEEEEEEEGEKKQRNSQTPNKEIEDSKDSGNEEDAEEEVDEDLLRDTSLPIIIEEDIDDNTWLPLPGALPPSEGSPRRIRSPANRVTFLNPPSPRASYRTDFLGELPEEPPDSPDLNYSLRGDRDEERKYYIYKVRDVNMVPKKECVGKVVVPAGGGTASGTGSRSSKLSPRAGVTLEDLRQLIRHSSDEMLQDAAKQRFRYLSESYHLVAADESFTPVDQIYPTQGVFIKLDNEHPFSKPRIDTSLTARLQSEYERRFGPIAPRRQRKSSVRQAKWDILTSGINRNDPNAKSIYDEPIPFNSQVIKDQFERQQSKTNVQRINKRRRSLSNFRYDSFDYADGKYKDSSNRKRGGRECESWNPDKGSFGVTDRRQQRKRYAKGQRPPWKF